MIEQIIMSRAKVVIVPPGLVQCLVGRFSAVIEQIIMGRAKVVIMPPALCVSLSLLCLCVSCVGLSVYEPASSARFH